MHSSRRLLVLSLAVIVALSATACSLGNIAGGVANRAATKALATLGSAATSVATASTGLAATAEKAATSIVSEVTKAKATPTHKATSSAKPTATTQSQYKVSIKLDKDSYMSGAEATLSYQVPDNLPDSSWVGLFHADAPHGDEATNNDNDINWQYIESKPKGELIFPLPDEVGAYEFRLVIPAGDDSEGQDIISVHFEIKVANEVNYKVELTLEQEVFAPGDEIFLQFKVNQKLPDGAWIGIIPSNVPHGEEATNDDNDIAYYYVRDYLEEGNAGSMTFTAPDEPGKYDLRLNSDDGNDAKEIGSIGFTVKK